MTNGQSDEANHDRQRKAIRKALAGGGEQIMARIAETAAATGARATIDRRVQDMVETGEIVTRKDGSRTLYRSANPSVVTRGDMLKGDGPMDDAGADAVATDIRQRIAEAKREALCRMLDQIDNEREALKIEIRETERALESA